MVTGRSGSATRRRADVKRQYLMMNGVGSDIEDIGPIDDDLDGLREYLAEWGHVGDRIYELVPVDDEESDE
jgi:hypothetical protein